MNFLKKLENPDMPLLGPNVKALKFCGLIQPEKPLMKLFYIIIHLSAAVFIFTEYVDLWLIRSDINLLLKNLMVSMNTSISIFKLMTFYIWQKRWIDIIDYVNRADKNQRRSCDCINAYIIDKCTKYCRKITYFYCSLVLLTDLTMVLQSRLRYAISASYRYNIKYGNDTSADIIRFWMPFDKTRLAGYLATFLFEAFTVIQGTIWVTAFDINAIVIMVFFRAEVQLLRRDCANMFSTESPVLDDKEALDRLRECCKRHIELLKYTRLFNSCVSPVMFLYMTVVTFMLCTTANQMTVDTSTSVRFMLTVYLFFGISQLFLFCWHSNEVIFANKYLILGPYESQWWTQSVSRQKDVCILINQFRQPIVFTAGPFTELTVTTFISILKAAYSYFTVLNKSNNE